MLGALIGVERQWRQRTAGLRTNALVALGSAVFVDVSSFLAGPDSVARVLAQVVTGVGFLGAGVIMKEGLNIRGLNTAATLWCASAIGAVAGAGYIEHAAIACALVVGANVLLRHAAILINRTPVPRSGAKTAYALRVICPANEETRFAIA